MIVEKTPKVTSIHKKIYTGIILYGKLKIVFVVYDKLCKCLLASS